MRHTIKVMQKCSVAVQAADTAPADLIALDLAWPESRDGVPMGASKRVHLTPDQCGALMFALEQACDALGVRRCVLAAAA